MTTPRVVFLGTPEASIPSLEAAAAAFDLVGVVTQPDRHRGRGRASMPTPVAIAADELGIAVRKPERSTDIVDTLVGFGPIDVALLVAYGQLIRQDALVIPGYGVLNLHFSLLPSWRGAAPVERAIMNGDRRTGVTVMLLDAGLDTGPMLSTWSVAIGTQDTAGTLRSRLAQGGADLLVDTATRHMEGRVVPIAQQSARASFAPKLQPEDRAIDWSAPATDVRARIQGLSPRPGASTELVGSPFRILRATVVEQRPDQGVPGSGVEVAGWPVVACGHGMLRLDEVQPSGKRPMPGSAWLRGRRGEPWTFGHPTRARG